MENPSDNQGVFINGKAQIIEMLPLLTHTEREKLINNIRARNGQLADELVEESITFRTILDLKPNDAALIFQYVQPAVLGVALKSFSINDQRKVLNLCDRDFAVKAFEAMNANISNEQKNTIRACQRIKDVIVTLMKKKRIL